VALPGVKPPWLGTNGFIVAKLLVGVSVAESVAAILTSVQSLPSPLSSSPKSPLSAKSKKKLVAPNVKPETSIGFHIALS